MFIGNQIGLFQEIGVSFHKMKTYFKKVFKVGTSKVMLSGVLGKRGLFGYSGVKAKSGHYLGGSLGLMGKNIYAGKYTKRSSYRVKHNLNSGFTSGKIKNKYFKGSF
jgi:hypothetical protein